MACTPPTIIRSASPCRRTDTAWCTATNEEEHAVSRAMAGPSSPRAYATLPATVLKEVPLTVYRLAAGSLTWLAEARLTPR